MLYAKVWRQQMQRFPIILIPPKIQSVMALPVVQQVSKPHPPVLPKQPLLLGSGPQLVNKGEVALKATVFATFSLTTGLIIAAALSPRVGFIVGALAFLAFAYQLALSIRAETKSFPHRQRQYERKQQLYLKQKQLYERALEHFPEQQRQYKEGLKRCADLAENQKVVAAQRRDSLDRVLSQTVPHDGTKRAKRGNSEADFGNHLRRHFPGFVYTDLTLHRPNFDYPYIPDFVYLDRTLNFYIDIEIDEPYAYDTREPIHYAGLPKNGVRNGFFLEQGWIVIRFSEEQVVRWPRSCCKTVAKAIAQVLGDNALLNQFANVPDLQPMGQWTEEEAKRMAASGYRDKYLN